MNAPDRSPNIERMTDTNDLFTENTSGNNRPDQESSNGSGSIQSASGATETSESSEAPRTTEKRVPAATANSYRDIIAERLAAKKAQEGGGSSERTERPERTMAHAGGWQDRPERSERPESSEPAADLKFTRKQDLDATVITESAAGVIMSTTDVGADMPSSIEAATQSMETDAPPASGGQSSRDRAR